MSDSNHPQIVCDGCGKKYKWQDKLAGKKVRCGCGNVISVAAMVAAPVAVEEPDDLYALAADADAKRASAEAATRVAPVSAPAPVAPAPTNESRPGLASAGVDDPLLAKGIYRRKGLTEEPKKEYTVSPLRDFILPPILVVVGIILCFIEAMHHKGNNYTFAQVAPLVIPTIIANLLLVIGGLFIASAIGGVAFPDKVPITILKICAVALAPGAIGGILDPLIGGINGNIVGTFAAFGLYFALFALLFRIAAAEMVTCVMMVWIIRIAILYAAYKFEGYRTGSEI
jgi:hypothetical protein